MSLQYKLEIFEGPLDLLLHLIDKAEIDIYNIPIREITDQFMDYLQQMRSIDLEPTSEFLVMAATLLAIKSKMLLPRPPKPELGEEEEEDPRAELVQRLLEYRKYKEAAEHLRSNELERSKIYTRPPGDLSAYVPEWTENPLRGIFPADLLGAFRKVLAQADKRQQVARIRRDEISVKDRIAEVVDVLERAGGRVRFFALFDQPYREQIVVTFLALLELMKMKAVYCIQDQLFDEIVIVYREEYEQNATGTESIN